MFLNKNIIIFENNRLYFINGKFFQKNSNNKFKIKAYIKKLKKRKTIPR